MPIEHANGDEREVIFKVLERSKLNTPAAQARALKAFASGEVGQVSKFESWFTIDREENPTAWGIVPTGPDAVVTELERQAFTGNGAAAASARAKLVKTLGSEDLANISARKFGLKSIGDFATKGVAPESDKGGDDTSKDKDKSSNPWKDDSPQGEARRIAAIRSLPTHVSAGLAKAAGRDLAGRVLRSA
jgi:hypothetical protein